MRLLPAVLTRTQSNIIMVVFCKQIMQIPQLCLIHLHFWKMSVTKHTCLLTFLDMCTKKKKNVLCNQQCERFDTFYFIYFFLIPSAIMSVNQPISILHQLPHSRLMAKDPRWCCIFFHLTANCTGHLSHSVSSLTLSLLGCQSQRGIHNT